MKIDALTKMMIFMFLGLIFAIAVLGYHKSPGVHKLSTNISNPKALNTPEFPVTPETITTSPYGVKY